MKALVKNIELCGVRNAVVTNDTPQKLASNLEGFFDRILVDAPCSGEGMFRKDEDAAKSWENFKCEKCASMQREILKHVDTMLKPGGYILYSTCTFSPEEDEIMITEFLDENNDYELCKIPLTAGIERGRPLWADGNERLEKTVRLWPHKLKGEGHFAALLRKKPGTKKTIFSLSPAEKKYDISIFKAFVKENLNIDMEGFFDIKGNNLYWLPEQPPEMRGIKVAKFGWYLGELSHGKFQPSHSMLTALNKKDFKNVIDFHGDSREINSYLKGETLMVEGQKGYWAVCVDGYTIGLAKQTGDVLKNMYPKGWRKMN